MPPDTRPARTFAAHLQREQNAATTDAAERGPECPMCHGVGSTTETQTTYPLDERPARRLQVAAACPDCHGTGRYRAPIAKPATPDARTARKCPPLRRLAEPCATCGAKIGQPCPPRPRIEPTAADDDHQAAVDLEQIRAVECPHCHAKPGAPCIRPSGHRTFGGEPHAERQHAAVAAAGRPLRTATTRAAEAERAADDHQAAHAEALEEHARRDRRAAEAERLEQLTHDDHERDRRNGRLDSLRRSVSEATAPAPAPEPPTHDAHLPTAAIQQPPTPVHDVPARRIPCPQCHAGAGEACRNYRGQAQGSYHYARKAAAAPSTPGARTAAARAAKHAAADATTARRATVAAVRTITTTGPGDTTGPEAHGYRTADGPPDTPGQADPPTPINDPRPQPSPTPARPRPTPAPQSPTPPPPAKPDGLTDLDRTVEQLVRQHTCGAVIDAAWAAARRLFHPIGGRP